MNFKNLHVGETPILICNVWDVQSAMIAQQLNFKAIGTSSGAIATMLGYNDGEEISFEELEYIVGRITKTTDIPLTVDLEAGYSREPYKIVEHIKRLEQLGVVGINIEDSIVNDNRALLPADEFSKILTEITANLAQQKINMFINVRTDTFLLGLTDAVEKTIERAKKYSKAGTNGLFVPCITGVKDIKLLIQAIDLPLNVMCMPNLPDFDTLKNLGVKRISMGNFVYDKIGKVLSNELATIQSINSFQNLFV
jgi:2-methylisocitrate lyase-like PEP mutase family enzyme